jgi:hypothetical protein
MKGNDDEPTTRSGKSDPKAKTLEKKGATPPEQPAITIDKAETSQETYVSERATLIDDNVQPSASDVREYDPPPGGITSTPMSKDGKKLASVTPYHGGEAESCRFEEDVRLTALGTLQVPGKAASNIGKTTKTAKGAAARSITLYASTKASERTKRTGDDSKALAEGKLLEPRVSRKQGKKVSPGSGTGRGRGTEGRGGSIVGTKVNKLNRLKANAAKLAAAVADKANSNQSMRNIDMQRYIDSQEDKTGQEAPADPDQGPPDDSSSSEGEEDRGEKLNGYQIGTRA